MSMTHGEPPVNEVQVDEVQASEGCVGEVRVPISVFLQGLMFGRFVFCGEPLSPYYEIGVLPAKCHDFTVCFEVRTTGRSGGGVQLTGSEVAPPSEGCYVLEIYRPDGHGHYYILPSNASRYTCSNVEFNRPRLSMLPDIPDPIKEDYRWVSDLEGNEFHTTKLHILSKKVHPIIKFPNGRVHTAKLTANPFERTQGGDPECFGYMGDVVGIDIQAKPGDVLILRERKATDAIIRIRLVENTEVIIRIRNVPPAEPVMDHSTSHFKLYYGAISDAVTPFDFIPIERPAAPMMDLTVVDDATNEELSSDDTGPIVDPPLVCRPPSGGGGAPLCGGVHMSKHDTEF